MKEYFDYLDRKNYGERLSWRKEWKKLQDQEGIWNLVRFSGRKCDKKLCQNRLSVWGTFQEGRFFPKRCHTKDWIAILQILKEEQALKEEEWEALKDWICRYPSHHPYIENAMEWLSFYEEDPEHSSIEVALSMRKEKRREFPAYDTPMLMNLELTTRCPLRCPQCYCSLEGGRDLSIEQAKYWVEQAALNGVQQINLSGGETMCYPDLFLLMAYIREMGMKSNVALSGYNFDKEVLEKMCQNGVNDICISLNGPTEEINRWSRDGFSLAMSALEILKDFQFPRTTINWVMHRNNADSLPQMTELAEKYNVRELVVMVFKPDSQNQRKSVPTKEQLLKTARFMKDYRGPVELVAEDCFSQMRMLLGRSFIGNRNRGLGRGCGAGRDGVSVTVDGKLTPCRHLEVPEDFSSLKEYWENSLFLKEIRKVEDQKQEPCKNCQYEKYCLPCLAVNWKQKGKIFIGEETCKLHEREERKE